MINAHEFPSTAIPRIFYPFEEESPFRHCVSCHQDLLENDVEYVIEKAIRQYPEFGTKDTIFEYAMCINCAEQMKKNLSDESLKSIQAYMMKKSNLLEQSQKLQASQNWNCEDWISHCIFTGQSIEEQGEYQIFAHCKGDQLLFSAMPYMVSSQAMEEMAKLLSTKTQDELNRFIDNNFGLPPELKKLFKENPVILL